jgi:tetratricopeptide (TPR) repeat protein
MTLVHKDLVRPDRPVLAGEDAFRFRHLLIRDAAYQALAKADRAQLHETFARWLEEHGSELVELDEIAGYHLEQAFGYRRELGPADEQARQLAADAAAHLDAAGRRALDRGDTGAAVSLLERAEALLPEQMNLDRQQSLIWSLAQSGRLDDAVSRAARIADACAAAGDRVGELRARLAGAIWQVSIDPNRWSARLRALVEEARPAIEQDGDDAALAALEYAAGEIDLIRGQNGAALAAYSRAMRHARQAGELWLEASIRGWWAAAAMAMGPTPRAQALRWLEDAEAHSATYQPQLVGVRAYILAELGRFDEARPLMTETLAQMKERGMRLHVAIWMQEAWEIEMLAGEHAAAERAARQGCEQLERLGEHSFLSTEACQLAEALYALGRYDEAEQWALRGLELGSRHDLTTQVLGLGVRSRILARKGQASAALALAEEADSLAGTSDSPWIQGDAALNLAEVLHLAGDRVRAAEMTQRAIECYQRNGATARAVRARRLARQWAG